MRTEFLCFSVLRVTLGPRVKLAGRKSALNPQVVNSTDCSKAVVPVLVLVFVALWFILQGDLFYVLPCVIYTPTYEYNVFAGLGGSVGCAVRLETRRSRVQPPPRSATFFRGD